MKHWLTVHDIRIDADERATLPILRFPIAILATRVVSTNASSEIVPKGVRVAGCGCCYQAHTYNGHNGASCWSANREISKKQSLHLGGATVPCQPTFALGDIQLAVYGAGVVGYFPHLCGDRFGGKCAARFHRKWKTPYLLLESPEDRKCTKRLLNLPVICCLLIVFSLLGIRTLLGW